MNDPEAEPSEYQSLLKYDSQPNFEKSKKLKTQYFHYDYLSHEEYTFFFYFNCLLHFFHSIKKGKMNRLDSF